MMAPGLEFKGEKNNALTESRFSQVKKSNKLNTNTDVHHICLNSRQNAREKTLTTWEVISREDEERKGFSSSYLTTDVRTPVAEYPRGWFYRPIPAHSLASDHLHSRTFSENASAFRNRGALPIVRDLQRLRLNRFLKPNFLCTLPLFDELNKKEKREKSAWTVSLFTVF